MASRFPRLAAVQSAWAAWAEPTQKPAQPASSPMKWPPISHVPPSRHDAIFRLILWPIAALIVAHRVCVLAANGHITDDYTTVFLALRRFWDGIPVYSENYSFVDPHYLYNPGATMILSPLALVGHVAVARMVFICGNAAAIIAAVAILMRIFGFRLRGWGFPLVVAVAFVTEAVQNTLIFANINGVLLLALVGFLWALLGGRQWWAGVILGLAIVIKPVFLPLLVLPLVKFQWRTMLAGVGLPAALNAVAWLVVPGAGEYVSRTMPYLKQVRDYANSSLPGLVTYFGLPGWVGTVLFLVLAAVVVAGVWFLLRLRHSDPLLWACATSGLLLSGAFLLSSLGQMYYSMMLFPLVATVVLRRSPMHSAAGAVGMVLCLSPLEWEFARWPVYGQWLDTFLPTVGWLCVVVATAMFGFQAFRRPPGGE